MTSKTFTTAFGNFPLRESLSLFACCSSGTCLRTDSGKFRSMTSCAPLRPRSRIPLGRRWADFNANAVSRRARALIKALYAPGFFNLKTGDPAWHLPIVRYEKWASMRYGAHFQTPSAGSISIDELGAGVWHRVCRHLERFTAFILHYSSAVAGISYAVISPIHA